MTKTYDVAVIGAGVFGAWTALCLRNAGAEVLLVDAYGPGNSRASSGGESRLIRLGYGPAETYPASAQPHFEPGKQLFPKGGQETARLFKRQAVLCRARNQ